MLVNILHSIHKPIICYVRPHAGHRQGHAEQCVTTVAFQVCTHPPEQDAISSLAGGSALASPLKLVQRQALHGILFPVRCVRVAFSTAMGGEKRGGGTGGDPCICFDLFL